MPLWLSPLPVMRTGGTTPPVAAAAGRYSQGWGVQGPARWVGSSSALARFGIEHGMPVAQRDLELALRAHRPADGALVHEIVPSIVEPGEAPTPEVVHQELTFVARPQIAELRSRASPDQRALIDDAMVRGVEAALHSLTNQHIVVRRTEHRIIREVGTGCAAAAVVKATPGVHGATPRLEVRAVVVGVASQGGKLVDADIPRARQRSCERQADLAAHEAMRDSVAEIEQAVPATHAVQAPSAIGREDVYVPNPVDRYAAALGPARAEALRTRVTAIATSLRDRPTEELQARREQLGEPFEHLDQRKAASVVARERRREQLAFEQLAETLEPGALDDGRRAARVAELQESIARHVAGERSLRETGHHPDQFVDDHGERAAETAAIDLELGTRREVEVANDVERAIAEPTTQLLDALGPAPSGATPPGVRWESLARDLEWTRRHAEGRDLGHARADALDERARADDAELQRNVDAWRQERGLDRPHGAAVDGPDVGM